MEGFIGIEGTLRIRVIVLNVDIFSECLVLRHFVTPSRLLRHFVNPYCFESGRFTDFIAQNMYLLHEILFAQLDFGYVYRSLK